MMNDNYRQGVIDVLDLINSVEDGDLDYIVWKINKFLDKGKPLLEK